MTKKKTIIFSNYDDRKNPFYGGGGAWAIHKVACMLCKKYRVIVITSKYPGSKNGYFQGVYYKRIGLAQLGPKTAQLLYSFLLPFYVMRLDFDLWIESFTPPFSTGFLPLFTQKPVIGLVHMLSSADMQRKYKLPFYLVENLGLRLYKNFIVTSALFGKKIVLQNKKAQIFIIPNGIDQIKLIKSAQEKYILFAGRLEVNQKGIDLLLASYAAQKAKIQLPLIIAGEGTKKEKKKIESLINTYQLTASVKLEGKVSRRKMVSLYSKAAVVIVPSRFETFSMTALESLAFGKPLVAFNIDGLKWLPSNASLKVKPFNKVLLSSAIIRLIEDKEKRVSFGKAGSKIASGYLWSKIGRKYQKSINFVLKEQQHYGFSH